MGKRLDFERIPFDNYPTLADAVPLLLLHLHGIRTFADSFVGGLASFRAIQHELAGMVLLSGYPDPLYDGALSDWQRLETESLADGARKRTEVLWLSPAAIASLNAERLPLFQGAA